MKNKYNQETNGELEEADKALAIECIDYRLGIDVGNSGCPACNASTKLNCVDCSLDVTSKTKIAGLCVQYCKKAQTVTVDELHAWLEVQRRSIIRMKTTPSRSE